MNHTFELLRCPSYRESAPSPLDIPDTDIDLGAHTVLDQSQSPRMAQIGDLLSSYSIGAGASKDYRSLLGEQPRAALMVPTRDRGLSVGSDGTRDYDTDSKKLQRIREMIQTLPEGALPRAVQWKPEGNVAPAARSTLRKQSSGEREGAHSPLDDARDRQSASPANGNDVDVEAPQRQSKIAIVADLADAVDSADAVEEPGATAALNAAPAGHIFSVVQAFYAHSDEHAFTLNTTPAEATSTAFDIATRAAYAALPDEGRVAFARSALRRLKEERTSSPVGAEDWETVLASQVPHTVLAYRLAIRDVKQGVLASLDRGVTRSSKLHGKSKPPASAKEGRERASGSAIDAEVRSQAGMTYPLLFKEGDGLDESALFGDTAVSSGPPTIGLEAIRHSRFGITFTSCGIPRSNDAEIRMMQTLQARIRDIDFAVLKDMHADLDRVEFQLDIVSSKAPCNSCAFAMSVFAESLSNKVRESIGIPGKLHLNYVVSTSRKETAAVEAKKRNSRKWKAEGRRDQSHVPAETR